jgi:hypothetical protein
MISTMFPKAPAAGKAGMWVALKSKRVRHDTHGLPGMGVKR